MDIRPEAPPAGGVHRPNKKNKKCGVARPWALPQLFLGAQNGPGVDFLSFLDHEKNRKNSKKFSKIFQKKIRFFSCP